MTDLAPQERRVYAHAIVEHAFLRALIDYMVRRPWRGTDKKWGPKP